jgi:hypothetical protein
MTINRRRNALVGKLEMRCRNLRFRPWHSRDLVVSPNPRSSMAIASTFAVRAVRMSRLTA